MKNPDIIFDSMDLRDQCRKRIEQEGVKVGLLAREVGIDPWRIKRWLENHPKTSIFQHQIVTVAKLLGIDVKIQIVIDDPSVISSNIKPKPDDKSETFKKRYERGPDLRGLNKHLNLNGKKRN